MIAAINRPIKYLKQIILFSMLLIYTSPRCQEVNNSRLIIGEWKTKKTKDEYEIYSTNHGYQFLPNGKCEYKPGFWKKGKHNYSPYTFLGTSTRYKLRGNTLRVYNPSKHNWKKATIEFHSNDTLLLEYRDGSMDYYYRMNYSTKKTELYDEIIVSGSGCFGNCPIDNTYLKKDGTVLYYNEEYYPFILYQLKLDSAALSKINLQFVKANIEGMKTYYTKDVTDDETITVTFLKNGKIVKSILDYANSAPEEFYWAYTPVLYIYQQRPRTPITATPNYLKIQNLNFESKKERSDLRKSENFYLWSLLLGGKEVQHPFETIYTLDYNSRDSVQQTIKTDGRLISEGAPATAFLICVGSNIITCSTSCVYTKLICKTGVSQTKVTIWG